MEELPLTSRPSWRIHLSPPDVNETDRDALLRGFDSGWIAPAGPELDLFEREMADCIGVSGALALSSGTAALHLALLVVGVRPGDIVLVSDLTFIATANAIRYVGAVPVFIDADPATWQIDVELVERECKSTIAGRRIGAVIAVDLYGQTPDFDRILNSCRAAQIPVIEDAAEALGATYRGRPAGSLGDLGVFSFNGNKTITTSGGGMLVSNRDEWIAHAHHLSTQAREPVLHYEHREVGFNYRLSNLLAALGRSQLQRLAEKVGHRRLVNRWYREALAEVDGVTFMPDPGWGEPSCWLSVIVIDELTIEGGRNAVIRRLAAEGIESRPTWMPMHLQPVFANESVRGGSIGDAIFRSGMCLPSGSALSRIDVEEVVSIVEMS